MDVRDWTKKPFLKTINFCRNSAFTRNECPNLDSNGVKLPKSQVWHSCQMNKAWGTNIAPLNLEIMVWYGGNCYAMFLLYLNKPAHLS